MNKKKITYDTLSLIKNSGLNTPFDNINLYKLCYLQNEVVLRETIHVLHSYIPSLSSNLQKRALTLLKIHNIYDCNIGYCVKDGFHNDIIKIKNGKCPKCGRNITI